MTQTAHTTGPWAVGGNGFKNHVITNGTDKVIAVLDPNGSLSEEENKANAEFIAAGPDIEKALRFWFPYIEGHFQARGRKFDDEIDKLRTVLAKAGIE